jgi:hypothetical protein
MRAAAAEARAVLVQMASARLGVPVGQIQVKDGIVADVRDASNSVTYGELAKGKKLEKYLDYWAKDGPGGIGENIIALFKAMEEM